MDSKLVRLIPPGKEQGSTDPNQWRGRLACFELVTGTRVSGRILAVSDVWIDTDNGAIRVEHIVHARWVGEEEAKITRGGPLGNDNTYRLR